MDATVSSSLLAIGSHCNCVLEWRFFHDREKPTEVFLVDVLFSTRSPRASSSGKRIVSGRMAFCLYITTPRALSSGKRILSASMVRTARWFLLVLWLSLGAVESDACLEQGLVEVVVEAYNCSRMFSNIMMILWIVIKDIWLFFEFFCSRVATEL